MFNASRDSALTGGVGAPEVTDSERRLADLIKFGEVKEVNYAEARVRVMIGDEDDDEGHTVTGWLPMAGARARGDSDWHPLEVGERVVVLSESGELQNGIVMPAGIYSEEDPAPGDKAGLWRKRFQDGSTVEYDRETGEFKIDAKTKQTLMVGDATITVQDGSIVLSAGGQSLTLSAEGITSSGKIAGEDGLAITGGTFTHDGKNVGKNHTHSGVQTGGGISGGPI